MTSYGILYVTMTLFVTAFAFNVMRPSYLYIWKALSKMNINPNTCVFTKLCLKNMNGRRANVRDNLKWSLNQSVSGNIEELSLHKRSINIAKNLSMLSHFFFLNKSNKFNNNNIYKSKRNDMSRSLNIGNIAMMHGSLKNKRKKDFRKGFSTKQPVSAGEQNFNVTSKSSVEELTFKNDIMSLNHDNKSKETKMDKESPQFDDFRNFMQSIILVEQKLYKITHSKLLEISPEDRRKNGFSFVQSGIFLYVALLALSTEVDPSTREQIYTSLNISVTNEMIYQIIDQIITRLPVTNGELRFRWSFRLVLDRDMDLSQEFRDRAAPTLRLHIHQFNTTEAPNVLANSLNNMVEIDSGNTMHNTFEDDELLDGIRGVLLMTLYLRGRWRSAPTLLNNTMPFLDGEDPGGDERSARMIRINDIMRYADLQSWGAEAIEINYATKGLSLLIIVPKDRLLTPLVELLSNTSLDSITDVMQQKRVAITMPLFTQRMTLLLPNKLQAMGITRLVDVSIKDKQLRLSHAVQRIMFWSEAGRNAFKDDGIEWDEHPELEVIVNRPYAFFVRWNNITLMNGNFAL